MRFDYLCIFLFWKKKSLQALSEYLLFPGFLKINENTLSFEKFQEIYVSENIIAVNITVQIIDKWSMYQSIS